MSDVIRPPVLDESFNTQMERIAVAIEGITAGAGVILYDPDEEYSTGTIGGALKEKISEPAAEGTAGQVLATYGDGTRYWKTVSGGGGASDYTELSNKPKINNVELSGNKSASDLGLLTASDINGKENSSNKVVSLSASSTDAQYPSAKCVYDIVGDVESLLEALL